MKKLLTILLATSLLVVACGKDKEEKKETKFEIRRINRTWSSDGYVTGSWKRNHDNAAVT